MGSLTAVVQCPAKHTTIEPTDAEWVCPKCGAKDGALYIDNSDAEATEGCLLLHKRDELRCDECRHVMTGEAFVRKLLKQQRLVECSCCRGTGVRPVEVVKALKVLEAAKVATKAARPGGKSK